MHLNSYLCNVQATYIGEDLWNVLQNLFEAVLPFLIRFTTLFDNLMEQMEHLDINIDKIKYHFKDCSEDLAKMFLHAQHYISSINTCLTNAKLEENKMTLMKTQLKEMKGKDNVLAYLGQLERDYKATVTRHDGFVEVNKAGRCKHAAEESENLFQGVRTDKVTILKRCIGSIMVGLVSLAALIQFNRNQMIINILVALIFLCGSYFLISHFQITAESARQLLKQIYDTQDAAKRLSLRITHDIFQRVEGLKVDIDNVINCIKGGKGFCDVLFDNLINKINELKKRMYKERKNLEEKLSKL